MKISMASAQSTLGIEFDSKKMRMEDGRVVQIQFWDTAGQERFRAITQAHYRRASGALIVYDVTSRESFENISKVWYPELRVAANRNVECTLVCNKIDLLETAEDSLAATPVDESEHDALAEKLKLKAFRTSVKTGANVREVFEDIIKRMYERRKKSGEIGGKAPIDVLRDARGAASRGAACC